MASEPIYSMSAFQWVAIAMMIAAAIAVFTLVVIGLFMLYLRRNRQLLHTERMRAIEMGQPFEAPVPDKTDATAMHNTFWIAFWLVFGVPGAAFSAAASTVNRGELSLGIAIWASASAASVAAVICATVLMLQSRTSCRSSSEPASPQPVKNLAKASASTSSM